MLVLQCGRDLVELNIRTNEGWNITAFLDHLDACEECSRVKGALIDNLNKLIGGEK